MSEPHFQKRLGLFDATMLVAGSMIGSGIYIVSAGIAREVGGSGWLLMVWGLAGLMTVLGALAYAELAAMMPHAGGQYVYLREAYSPLWGFLYGWTSFTVIQTGTIAAVGVAFAKFLGVLWPYLGIEAEGLMYTGSGFAGIPLPLPWLDKPLQLFAMEHFHLYRGQLVGVGTIVFLTAWNTLGIQQGKILQNIFTVTKIGSLFFVIAVGLFVTYNSDIFTKNFADPWVPIASTKTFRALQREWPSFAPILPLMVMGGAMVGALFSADAWNNVTFTAGEVQNPQRNLPRSLILGTGGVIGLYLLTNVVYLASLPIQPPQPIISSSIDAKAARDKQGLKTNPATLERIEKATALDRGISYAKDDRVATAMLEVKFPQWGVGIMAVAIMISTFGCNNGLILMGGRLTYAMARDGLFFRNVGHLNRNGVPAAGLWFQAVWASLLTFSGTYNDLLDYVIFAVLLFYALTVIGLFVLRIRRPNAERPYRALGFPLAPALYVFLCLAVMIDLLIVKPVYTWPGLILVLLGVPVYFVWKAFAGKRESMEG